MPGLRSTMTIDGDSAATVAVDAYLPVAACVRSGRGDVPAVWNGAGVVMPLSAGPGRRCLKPAPYNGQREFDWNSKGVSRGCTDISSHHRDGGLERTD